MIHVAKEINITFTITITIFLDIFDTINYPTRAGGRRRRGGDCGHSEKKSCRTGSRPCSKPSRGERGRQCVDKHDHHEGDADNNKDPECGDLQGKQQRACFRLLCMTGSHIDDDGAECARSGMMLIVLRKA